MLIPEGANKRALCRILAKDRRCISEQSLVYDSLTAHHIYVNEVGGQGRLKNGCKSRFIAVAYPRNARGSGWWQTKSVVTRHFAPRHIAQTLLSPLITFDKSVRDTCRLYNFVLGDVIRLQACEGSWPFSRSSAMFVAHLAFFDRPIMVKLYKLGQELLI